MLMRATRPTLTLALADALAAASLPPASPTTQPEAMDVSDAAPAPPEAVPGTDMDSMIRRSGVTDIGPTPAQQGTTLVTFGNPNPTVPGVAAVAPTTAAQVSLLRRVEAAEAALLPPSERGAIVPLRH